MNILGLNAFHADSSAALVVDGILISAVEEERYARIKHYTGFPYQSINFCLENANLILNDIDIISINTSTNYNLFNKILYAAKNPLLIKNHINKFLYKKKKTDVNNFLYEYFGTTKKHNILKIPHHLSHAASVALTSAEDSGLVFSFDAAGDFSTIEVYGKKNNKNEICKSIDNLGSKITNKI